MSLLRTLLMLAFWTVATPLAALVAIPHALITKRVGFLYRMGMWVAAAGVRIAGISVSCEGREHLDPDQCYIFMANHVSNIDPPVLIPCIPGRTSVLVKKELFRLPVLGPAMRIAQLVPVERSHRERAMDSLQRAVEVMRSGVHMTIFAEGTRSRTGRLLPFKKGPFYLAMETGVPVVPVTIVGTYATQPKGRFTVRGGPVHLVFHSPVEPRQFADREALMAVVRERIVSALPPEFQ